MLEEQFRVKFDGGDEDEGDQAITRLLLLESEKGVTAKRER